MDAIYDYRFFKSETDVFYSNLRDMIKAVNNTTRSNQMTCDIKCKNTGLIAKFKKNMPYNKICGSLCFNNPRDKTCIVFICHLRRGPKCVEMPIIRYPDHKYSQQDH